jgi:hypothetical protein
MAAPIALLAKALDNKVVEQLPQRFPVAAPRNRQLDFVGELIKFAQDLDKIVDAAAVVVRLRKLEQMGVRAFRSALSHRVIGFHLLSRIASITFATGADIRSAGPLAAASTARQSMSTVPSGPIS